jgi:hypothetical protein
MPRGLRKQPRARPPDTRVRDLGLQCIASRKGLAVGMMLHAAAPTVRHGQPCQEDGLYGVRTMSGHPYRKVGALAARRRCGRHDVAGATYSVCASSGRVVHNVVARHEESAAMSSRSDRTCVSRGPRPARGSCRQRGDGDGNISSRRRVPQLRRVSRLFTVELGWVSGTIFDTTSCMRRESVVGLHALLNARSGSDLSLGHELPTRPTGHRRHVTMALSARCRVRRVDARLPRG